MQEIKNFFSFLYWFIGYHYVQFINSDEKKMVFYTRQYKSFKSEFGGSIFIGDYKDKWYYICTEGNVNLCFMYYPITKTNKEFILDNHYINNREEFDIADGHIAILTHLHTIFKDMYVFTSIMHGRNDRVFHYLKHINNGTLAGHALLNEEISTVVKRLFYRKTIFPYCFNGKMTTYYRKIKNV